MASRSEVVSQELEALQENLSNLWVAISADPKKQARKERAWSVLSGALTIGATMLARRGTAKLWDILTGEPPPVGPARTAGIQQSAQPDEAQASRAAA